MSSDSGVDTMNATMMDGSGSSNQEQSGAILPRVPLGSITAFRQGFGQEEIQGITNNITRTTLCVLL